MPSRSRTAALADLPLSASRAQRASLSLAALAAADSLFAQAQRMCNFGEGEVAAEEVPNKPGFFRPAVGKGIGKWIVDPREDPTFAGLGGRLASDYRISQAEREKDRLRSTCPDRLEDCDEVYRAVWLERESNRESMRAVEVAERRKSGRACLRSSKIATPRIRERYV